MTLSTIISSWSVSSSSPASTALRRVLLIWRSPADRKCSSRDTSSKETRSYSTCRLGCAPFVFNVCQITWVNLYRCAHLFTGQSLSLRASLIACPTALKSYLSSFLRICNHLTTFYCSCWISNRYRKTCYRTLQFLLGAFFNCICCMAANKKIRRWQQGFFVRLFKTTVLQPPFFFFARRSRFLF